MTDRLTILCGDVLEQLSELPDESVNCCVTSPPYWGLRDYGTAQWEGGSTDCEHKVGRFETKCSDKQKSNNGSAGHQARECCPHCGAIRIDRQIGLEKTPQEFVARMVQVFREVRRVLRKDGVCWVNLGDSYHNVRVSTSGQSVHDGELRDKINGGNRNKQPGLKPKDLCGIPWRVAFALQDDGWWLRQDIIWHKPNPMPESVRDRCTKAHEYIFMLTKSARYWWDVEAIAERATTDPHNSGYVNGEQYAVGPMNRNGHSQREDPDRIWAENGNRNRRSVWTITTQPFPGSHFAVFPEELPKLCILASCPPDGTVLDPFAGSGTTGKVALELGRKAVLIELNPTYAKLIEDRCFVTPGFAL